MVPITKNNSINEKIAETIAMTYPFLKNIKIVIIRVCYCFWLYCFGSGSKMRCTFVSDFDKFNGESVSGSDTPLLPFDINPKDD